VARSHDPDWLRAERARLAAAGAPSWQAGRAASAALTDRLAELAAWAALPPDERAAEEARIAVLPPYRREEELLAAQRHHAGEAARAEREGRAAQREAAWTAAVAERDRLAAAEAAALRAFEAALRAAVRGCGLAALAETARDHDAALAEAGRLAAAADPGAPGSRLPGFVFPKGARRVAGDAAGIVERVLAEEAGLAVRAGAAGGYVARGGGGL
jgi:hypothetical protein